MKKEKIYLEELLNKKDIIVFACSGGPDSMCLFHLLQSLKFEKSLTLICAHVNHNVREESLNELEFVKEECIKNDIVFEVMEISSYKNKNFHQEARTLRYNFFESLIHKYHATYLMTAHHGDDLIETILMRIERGSSLKGYAGFEKMTNYENYSMIRPLITTTKDDILTYNKQNSISFVTDKSNESDHYTRNRYRHHLLPFLKQENPKVHSKFYEFSQNLCRINEFLVKSIENALTDCISSDKLLIDELLKKDIYIEREIIKKYLFQTYQNKIDLLNERHVENIIKLIHSTRTTGSINLPLNYKVIKNYRFLEIQKVQTKTFTQMEINKSVNWDEWQKIEKIEESEIKSNFVIRLNSKEISLPLYVRTRNNGDIIEVKGLNGTKKVSDILINEKVPMTKRDTIPLLVDAESRILWIPGVKKSKFDKEKTEKHDIIYKYILSKEKEYE